VTVSRGTSNSGLPADPRIGFAPPALHTSLHSIVPMA